MAEYKFDGKYLSHRGSRVGGVEGKYIVVNGSRVGEIEGKYIKDSHGSRIAELEGTYIQMNGTRVATVNDVRKAIDGPGGMTLVALWVLLIR